MIKIFILFFSFSAFAGQAEYSRGLAEGKAKALQAIKKDCVPLYRQAYVESLQHYVDFYKVVNSRIKSRDRIKLKRMQIKYQYHKNIQEGLQKIYNQGGGGKQ